MFCQTKYVSCNKIKISVTGVSANAEDSQSIENTDVTGDTAIYQKK